MLRRLKELSGITACPASQPVRHHSLLLPRPEPSEFSEVLVIRPGTVALATRKGRMRAKATITAPTSVAIATEHQTCALSDVGDGVSHSKRTFASHSRLGASLRIEYHPENKSTCMAQRRSWSLEVSFPGSFPGVTNRG